MHCLFICIMCVFMSKFGLNLVPQCLKYSAIKITLISIVLFSYFCLEFNITEAAGFWFCVSSTTVHFYCQVCLKWSWTINTIGQLIILIVSVLNPPFTFLLFLNDFCEKTETCLVMLSFCGCYCDNNLVCFLPHVDIYKKECIEAAAVHACCELVICNVIIWSYCL